MIGWQQEQINTMPAVNQSLGVQILTAHEGNDEIQPWPSKPRLNFTEGTTIFYHSLNKRAVNICFIHPIHRFFSSYQIAKSGK